MPDERLDENSSSETNKADIDSHITTNIASDHTTTRPSHSSHINLINAVAYTFSAVLSRQSRSGDGGDGAGSAPDAALLMVRLRRA